MHTGQHALLAALAVHDTGVPIYVQLRDQMLRAVGAGVLKRGEQMPTMRQVAVALRIDLNTVRHAYDELERLGAITLQRGRGSFVTETAEEAEAQLLDARTDELARHTLTAAAAAGVNPRDLAARILDLLEHGG
jgi:GntR family transcriptional regulator